MTEDELFFKYIYLANVCANCRCGHVPMRLITFNKGSENEVTEFWCEDCEAGL